MSSDADHLAIYDAIVAARGGPGVLDIAHKAIANRVAGLLAAGDFSRADATSVSSLMGLLPQPVSSSRDSAPMNLELLTDDELASLEVMIAKAGSGAPATPIEAQLVAALERAEAADAEAVTQQRLRWDQETQLDATRSRLAAVEASLAKAQSSLDRLASEVLAMANRRPESVPDVGAARVAAPEAPGADIIPLRPDQAPDCLPLLGRSDYSMIDNAGVAR
jgi:hypothetical protein